MSARYFMISDPQQFLAQAMQAAMGRVSVRFEQTPNGLRIDAEMTFDARPIEWAARELARQGRIVALHATTEAAP